MRVETIGAAENYTTEELFVRHQRPGAFLQSRAQETTVFCLYASDRFSYGIGSGNNAKNAWANAAQNIRWQQEALVGNDFIL